MKIYKAFAYDHERHDYCLMRDDDIMCSYFVSEEKCIQRANEYRRELGGDEVITETLKCSLIGDIAYGIMEIDVCEELA